MVRVMLANSNSCRNLLHSRWMVWYARTNTGIWSNPRTYERRVLRTAAPFTDRLQPCVLQGCKESSQSIYNEWR